MKTISIIASLLLTITIFSGCSEKDQIQIPYQTIYKAVKDKK